MTPGQREVPTPAPATKGPHKRWLDVERVTLALDAIRSHRDLSWRAVARESGIDPSVLHRLSSGGLTISADNLVALFVWAGISDIRPYLWSEVHSLRAALAQVRELLAGAACDGCALAEEISEALGDTPTEPASELERGADAPTELGTTPGEVNGSPAGPTLYRQPDPVAAWLENGEPPTVPEPIARAAALIAGLLPTDQDGEVLVDLGEDAHGCVSQTWEPPDRLARYIASDLAAAGLLRDPAAETQYAYGVLIDGEMTYRKAPREAAQHVADSARSNGVRSAHVAERQVGPWRPVEDQAADDG